MLDQQTIIHAPTTSSTALTDAALSRATENLASYGHCLLRGFNMDLNIFSTVIQSLCSQVTYDPARQMSGEAVQKVDAGTDAIGLHIENGNTPKIPHVLAFYCAKAAHIGSQTTLCDGIELLQALPDDLKYLFLGPMTVVRTLPEPLWKGYLAQEHPALTSADQVTENHLHEMLSAIPGQAATLNKDGSLTYRVTVDPLRISPFANQQAFANAVMGPSFNYQPPIFRLHDGTQLTTEQLAAICKIAEQHTHEIPWQNSDLLLVDNWRTMHGRRAIEDAAHRELFIGMGTV